MESETQTAAGKHLDETIGAKAIFSEWDAAQNIPYAIRGGYDFSQIQILGVGFIAISPKKDEEFSVAKLAKHLAWLDENHGQVGIFIAGGLESYNRKRLIEQKIPFIIPGNQIYLPDLGIDFREHLRGIRKKRSKLSPSAQMVLLAKLLGKFESENWTATFLAGCFESNKMKMSRAIDDLEGQGLIETRVEGREKQVHFVADGRKLWEKALPVLRSPVQSRVFVENVNLSLGTIAGLSALADQSMLVAPSHEIRALTNKAWKGLQEDTNLRIIPKAASDSAPLELEIWKYNPLLLGVNGKVDPLSLYLSLADTKDERVEGELEELLKGVKW